MNRKIASLGILLIVAALVSTTVAQRPARNREHPARTEAAEHPARPGGEHPAARREGDQDRQAQRLQRQMEHLKQEHRELVGELRAIHEVAVQENATQTAGKVEALISQQQESFQQTIRRLEQQHQRLNRANRRGGDRMRERISRGRRAPDFELSSYNGRNVDLSDYKGNIVVLEWFNKDCPFVKYHYEQADTMIDLAKKYKDKGVVWFAVDSTHTASAEGNREFAKKHNLPYPILDDRSGEVGRRYGAMRTPHIFIIDRTGHVVYSGAIDSAPLGKVQGDAGKVNYVEQALSELTSGGKVSTANTPPYGCTVKYPG